MDTGRGKEAKKMKIPGFSAEATLGRTPTSYTGVSSHGAGDQAVIPQMHLECYCARACDDPIGMQTYCCLWACRWVGDPWDFPRPGGGTIWV
jgi:hypothetical protein